MRLSWMAIPLGCLFSSNALFAQPDPTTSAATPADGPLQMIITDVTGKVQARSIEGGPWAVVEVGQQYPEGVEFRTGPKSVVKFDIPPDSSITLDRLGTVKVLRAAVENGTIKTDLGMKYGRTRYDIETAGRAHDAKIRSASSVLAIRGTDVILDDTPGFPPRASSVTGRAKFTDSTGQSSTFGKTGAAEGSAPVEVESGSGGAAQTSLQQSVTISPLNAGRTENENALVVNIPQASGLPPSQGSSSGAQGQVTPQPPGPPPSNVVPNPPAMAGFIPGQLQFVLDWTGNADLQIGVISPLGEGITTNPATVVTIPPEITGAIGTQVPSGGVASADNKGSGGSGRETITWPTQFPQGPYQYGVKYNTGGGTASFKLSVMINDVELDPPSTGILTGPTQDEFTSGATIEISPAPTQRTSSVQGGKKKKK